MSARITTDWEKEFNKYFDGHWGWNLPAEHIGLLETGIGIPSSEEVKEYIKPFIRTLLLARDEEIVGKLEEAKKEEHVRFNPNDEPNDACVAGYNLAITDAVSLIRRTQKGV